MKKLKLMRKSIDELAIFMPPVGEQEQQRYIGERDGIKKATLLTFAILLLLFSLFSCGQGQSLTSVNQKSVELNNRAAELMAGGKYDEALPLLDSALAISPSYEWALTNKVLSLEYLGGHRRLNQS